MFKMFFLIVALVLKMACLHSVWFCRQSITNSQTSYTCSYAPWISSLNMFCDSEDLGYQTFQCNEINIYGTNSDVLRRFYFVQLWWVSSQLNTIFEFLSASTFLSVCASAYPPPSPPPPTATLFSEQSSRSRQSAERKLEPGQRELFVNKLEAVSSPQGCCAMLSIAGHDFFIFVNKNFVNTDHFA